MTDSAARITLITDQSSSVSAVVLETEASGVVKHGTSSVVAHPRPRRRRTSWSARATPSSRPGWKTEQFESLFPRGIPIGTVESVGQQDVDLFKRIQIAPLVDFDSLAAVIVLIEKPQPAEQKPQASESPRKQEQEKKKRP